MAIVYQPTLFSWKDSHELGDLERLKMVMEALPDEHLIRALEERRGKGRNDYPIRAVWNSLVAGQIYQHPTIACLERELRRNAQLRELCGFDPLKGVAAVPTEDAYSRFTIALTEFQHEIDKIFNELVRVISELLPDFGRNLAIDSEALESFARGKGKPNREREQRTEKTDRRGDNDADWGKKYVFTDENGVPKRVTKVWFGYKLHLICDSKYELPVAYTLTRASVHDGPQAHALIDQLKASQQHVLHRCEHLMGDRAYDDAKLTTKLFRGYGIKTVVYTREMWKGDDERQLESQPEVDNVTYNEKGQLFCCCPKTAEKHLMPLGGFESNREAIKFKCPALHHGFDCPGQAACPVARGLRVPLAENRRIFTPVPRNSRNWDKLYKTRTSIERVFSRLDTSYGMDAPKLRGMNKFILKVSLTLSVMLALAVGRIRKDQTDRIGSLVHTA